jgi:hypothetical protein
MKVFAYILIVSMSLLGLNRSMVSFDNMAPQTEQTCSVDCCYSHDASCCNEDEAQDEAEAEDEPKKDIRCSGNCDCTSSIQVLALGIHIQSPPGLFSRTINHGSYHEEYYFEYLLPHFQPPRMA